MGDTLPERAVAWRGALPSCSGCGCSMHRISSTCAALNPFPSAYRPPHSYPHLVIPAHPTRPVPSLVHPLIFALAAFPALLLAVPSFSHDSAAFVLFLQ